MSCKLTLPSEWFTPPKKYCLKTSLLSPNDRPPVELSALLTPPKWKFVMTTLSDCDSNDIQSNWLLDIGSCCHLNGIYKMVPYPRHPSWIFSLASNIFPWNPRNLSSLNIIFSWHQIVTKRKPPTISIHCTDEIGESYSDLLYLYVNALPGCFGGAAWHKCIVIGGFSSGIKEPKWHKLGVFWANYGNKIGCFTFENGTLKSIYIEKVKFLWSGRLQAHPRTILEMGFSWKGMLWWAWKWVLKMTVPCGRFFFFFFFFFPFFIVIFEKKKKKKKVLTSIYHKIF